MTKGRRTEPPPVHWPGTRAVQAKYPVHPPPPFAWPAGKLVQKKAGSRLAPPTPPAALVAKAQPKMASPFRRGGSVVQRAEIEMTTYYPVPAVFPAGAYRLINVAAGRTFTITVARTARHGGHDVTIAVREPNGTNHAGVVRGDIVTATRTAYLNHIDVRGIAAHVGGLGALLVYIFACHVLADADTIVIATMSPLAAGFYQAVGFPVMATAAAYFNTQRQRDGADVAAWNLREQTFNQAVAAPQNFVGVALPGTPSPQRGTQQIITANAQRARAWRLL